MRNASTYRRSELRRSASFSFVFSFLLFSLANLPLWLIGQSNLKTLLAVEGQGYFSNDAVAFGPWASQLLILLAGPALANLIFSDLFSAKRTDACFSLPLTKAFYFRFHYSLGLGLIGLAYGLTLLSLFMTGQVWQLADLFAVFCRFFLLQACQLTTLYSFSVLCLILAGRIADGLLLNLTSHFAGLILGYGLINLGHIKAIFAGPYVIALFAPAQEIFATAFSLANFSRQASITYLLINRLAFSLFYLLLACCCFIARPNERSGQNLAQRRAYYLFLAGISLICSFLLKLIFIDLLLFPITGQEPATAKLPLLFTSPAVSMGLTGLATVISLLIIRFTFRKKPACLPAELCCALVAGLVTFVLY